MNYGRLALLHANTIILKVHIEATELWLIENARYAEPLTGH